MRHRVVRTRLKRSTAQRKALLEGLVKNLIIHQRIQTTHPRAKQAQRLADQLITLGKNDTVHSRRQAFAILQDRTMTKRLFDDLAPLFAKRSGGYTRVLHMNPRKGDAAPMALLEFVEKTDEFSKNLERRAETKLKKKAAAEAAAQQNRSENAQHDHSHDDGHTHDVKATEVVEQKPDAPAKKVKSTKSEESAKPAKSKKTDNDKGDDKENFVGNLKKFFKRKGKE